MSKRGDFYRGVTAEAYETKRSKSDIWQRENSVIEELFEKLKIPEQALVLDVPVGTGRFVDVYRKHRCRLIGVDISDEMLDQARARATSDEIFTQADITLLPLAESSIDAAVCIRFAYLVERKTLKAAIQELSRVIRPGGWLIIGARLESFNNTSDDANRLLSYLRRKRRTAQFRLGTADSRSESERWMFKALRSCGFRLTHRREITRYSDGSYYSIIVLEAPGEQDLQQAPRSVELFGLPGTGKTTLYKALHRVAGDTVVDGYKAIEKLSLVQCFLKRPVFTIRFFVRLLPVAKELKNLAAKKVVMYALRQHSVRNLPTSPVVYQEGTSHEVWRQLVAGQSLSDNFISVVLPVADMTVLMEAPRDTLADRLRSKRTPGPISRMLANEPIDSTTWDLAESAYLRIKASLKSVGAETVVLQNTGSVTDGAEALKRVIDAVQRLEPATQVSTLALHHERANEGAIELRATSERISAAEAADNAKQWLLGARLWESVFWESSDQEERRRGGRRAAMSYRSAGELDEARRLLRAVVAEFDPDGMTRRELARFEMAKQAASAPHRYWDERRRMLYLQVVKEISLRIACNARSVIDIGSAGTPVIEWFHGVPERVSLDLRNPYRGSGVESVKADLLDWYPERKFDVGLCLQVMEHVPDADRFAERLMELCEVLIVSVPYRWPKGKVRSHVNDPVDEAKVASWFGRQPNYSYRVAELTGHERIVCVFDTQSTASWHTVREEGFRYRWSLNGLNELLADTAPGSPGPS